MRTQTFQYVFEEYGGECMLILVGENVSFPGDEEAELKQKAISWLCKSYQLEDTKIKLLKRK